MQLGERIRQIAAAHVGEGRGLQSAPLCAALAGAPGPQAAMWWVREAGQFLGPSVVLLIRLNRRSCETLALATALRAPLHAVTAGRSGTPV